MLAIYRQQYISISAGGLGDNFVHRSVEKYEHKLNWYSTRSQAVARIADRTASQQTNRLLLNSISSCFWDIGL